LSIQTHLLLQAAALAVMSTPAFADDWAGGYLGASAGMVRLEDVSTASTVLALPIPELYLGGAESDGASLGAVGGYRWAKGDLVFGVEGDLDWLDAELEKSVPVAGMRVEAKWLASVRAVAGVPVGPTLLYASLGIGAGGIDYSYRLGASPAETESETPSHWTGGVGVEWKVAGVHPRLEYRHIEFGDMDHTALAFSFGHNASADSLRFGVVAPF
jgi:outer membrane immunogenic protein